MKINVNGGRVSDAALARLPWRRKAAAGLPPNYTTAVLAEIRRQYGHLLPDGVRFFDITLSDQEDVLLARQCRGRWLGYCLRAGWKVEGEPMQGIGPECATADVDGVWDFRAEFGVLLIRSPGHHTLSDQEFADQTLSVVMGSAEADVAGLRRWLEDQSKKSGVVDRRIVDLHGHSHSVAQAEPVRVDPDTVLLPAGAREALLHEVDLFCSGEDWYAAEGLPWRRGVLLYGPPGNGKTTAARMMASHLLDRGGAAYHYSFCQRCDDGDLRDAFERASRASPSLLILEDVDTLRETSVTRGCLLSLLDGTAGGVRGVFTVATTNYPEVVDPALVGRAGRFDRAEHLPAPGGDVRRTYLERWWSGRPQEVLLDAAVGSTEGLSIASLNEVRHFVAMHLREGEAPSDSSLRDFVGTLRRAEEARRDRGWARGRVGFQAGE